MLVGVCDGVEGGIWLVVLLCLCLGMVRGLAVVFTAGGWQCAFARDWGVDVCLQCMCGVGVRWWMRMDCGTVGWFGYISKFLHLYFCNN